MKTFTSIISIVILLIHSQILSQTENEFELFQYKLLQERDNSRSTSSKRIQEKFTPDNFKEQKSRTIVSNRIKDNGFLLIEEVWQYWAGSVWVNDAKWTYTYDCNNNIIELLLQVWDSSNWVNCRMGMFTYDGNNNMVEELVKIWDGLIWVNGLKYICTYDSNKNMIEELHQNWDGSNWVNSFRETYTYNGNNNLTETIEQDWDGANWINEWRGIYTYDMNNNMIEELVEGWEGSMWVNWWRTTYIYDANNNMIEEIEQDWDGSNWVNREKCAYTYIITEVDQLKEDAKTYSLSNNFPNPFNPSTKISYSVQQLSNVIIKVYDILGNEIETLVNEEKQVGTYEITWYAEGLPSGIYFYRLKAGDFVETKKMILLK